MRHSYLKIVLVSKIHQINLYGQKIEKSELITTFLFKTFSLKEPMEVTNVSIKQHSPFHKVLQPEMNL